MEAMCEDLNVAGAIGALSEAVSMYATDQSPSTTGSGSTLAAELQALADMDAVLGVLDLQYEASMNELAFDTLMP